MVWVEVVADCPVCFWRIESVAHGSLEAGVRKSGVNQDRIMLSTERDSLRHQRWIAVSNFRDAIHDMVALLEASGTPDSELDLAHLRIRTARGACEIARATLQRHQVEHGC
jgi:hypothetical protein